MQSLHSSSKEYSFPQDMLNYASVYANSYLCVMSLNYVGW